jgi:hypothetical protein
MLLYNLYTYGAILFVTVPETIIKSVCLGAGLNKKPKRSMSYRLMAACIISIAQHARPKVIGQTEPTLSQPISVINLSESQSSDIKKQKLKLRPHTPLQMKPHTFWVIPASPLKGHARSQGPQGCL